MKRRTFGKGVRWLMVLLAACLWLPSGGGSLAADPVNLVSNPGFENGLQSWGSWGNIASTQVSGNVHSGTTALSVTGPGGGYQDITTGVTSNTSYTLSAWGKRAGTGGAAFIGVKFKNASGGVISESSAIYWTELAYTQHSGTFTTPTGTVSLQLYAYVNSGAAGLFLDDVILTGGEPPVGSGTNYYVATNGNDSNPGTLASPFLTVQKAASVAIAGDTVNIRAGTYYEEVTPAYTGTSGHPITFQAYNGEAVTISGLARVTSTWTLHSGNVYKTTTALNLGSKNAVFADGEMMVPARWPNVGSWLDKSPALADNATSSTSGTTAILKGAATGPQMPNLNWAGAKVWAYVNWIGWTSPISASSNNQLTLTNNAPDGNTQLGYELNFAPIQYYIYDSLQALDTNKEWYYDAAAQTLYLYAPNGGSPSGYTIEKKVRESAFTLDGLSYIDIKGLTINGATIKASSSNHIRLDGLKLKNFGYDADSTGRYGSQLDIGLILKGDGIELRNSEIYNSSGYGIYITGNDAVIFNNYIHDIGYAGAFTSAFSVDGANAHISYNTLKRAGSTCTGGNMTFGALIEYNDFSYCGMISNDNGTMHWAKNDYQNTEIRYNYFHDGQDGAAHIYVDNASSNLLIHHNTVYNTSVSGKRAVLINQPANYIQFYNNMIDGSFVANSAQVFQDDTYKMAVYDNVFTEGYSITGPARVSNNSTAQGEFAMITGPGGTPGHNFTAPPTEPALSFTNHPDRNLVRNAGFEGMLDHYHVPNDLRYWTKTGAMNAVGQLSEHESINQDHGYTRTGEGSVRLGGGQDGIEQTITGLAPNTYYEIAGWAKVSTGEQARIGAKLYDASGGDTYATVTDTQGGWVRNIMTFKTGSQATSATIYLNKTTSGSGYVYGDDFGLVYLGATLPPPPPPAPGDNLLTNPGFEQDYASWSNGVNVTVDTANAHDGAKAIRVNSGAAGSGNQDASGGVVAGADYIVSAWGKLGAAGVTGAKLTVRAKNSAGQYITGSGVDAALSWSETVYTRKAVKFTMPTGAASVEVKFSKDGASGAFYLDDIALRQAINLLPNPGFEQSNQPLGFVADHNFDITNVGSDVHSGNQALQLTSAVVPYNGYAHTYLIHGVSPNTTYSITGWGKRRAGTAGTSFIATGYQETPGGPALSLNNNNQFVQLVWQETSYTQKTATFTTLPGTNIIKLVFWLASDSADWFVDDLTIEEVANRYVPDPPNPTNLLANPGFESGLQSWNSWGNFATTQTAGNVHGGTTALNVTASGGGYQAVTAGVSANTTYTLSAWGKRGGAGGAAFIGVKFKNAGGGVISESNAIYWTETAYTQHSGTFTTPAGTVSLDVYVYVNSGAASLNIDDFSLTAN